MIEKIVSCIIIITICVFVINMFSDVFSGLKKYLSDMIAENKRKEAVRKYVERKKLEENTKKDYKYFGLLELVLENCESEEKMKKEYYQIIQERLNSKYRQHNLQVFTLNRLFLECADFSIIDELISDVIEMFEYFSKTNSKKSIKTNLKFLLLAKDKNTNFTSAQKILLDINNINLLNQVIADSEFYNRYQKENLGLFEFHSKGIINLPKSDENIEIYRLVKHSK